mgnify:CR=1 FL=1
MHLDDEVGHVDEHRRVLRLARLGGLSRPRVADEDDVGSYLAIGKSTLGTAAGVTFFAGCQPGRLRC